MDLFVIHKTAVALTQISVYIKHKNLAVSRIIKTMCTAYANRWDSISTPLELHMRQTIHFFHWYVCPNFCTYIYHPLAYSVCIP